MKKIIFLMMFAINSANASTFIQATWSEGIIILNQSNGNIKNCRNFPGNSGGYEQTCSKIGSISKVGLYGNAVISIPISSQTTYGTIPVTITAIVSNSSTGAVVICYLVPGICTAQQAK